MLIQQKNLAKINVIKIKFQAKIKTEHQINNLRPQKWILIHDIVMHVGPENMSAYKLLC